MHLGRHATVLATVALILTGCGDDGPECTDLHDAPWTSIHGMDIHCSGHQVDAMVVAHHDVNGDKQDDAFVRLRCTTRRLGHGSDRLEVFRGGTACDNPKMLTVMVYEDEGAVLDGDLLVKSDGVYTFGRIGPSKVAWKLVEDAKIPGGWAISRPAASAVLED
jgi:hypothetical protein